MNNQAKINMMKASQARALTAVYQTFLLARSKEVNHKSESKAKPISEYVYVERDLCRNILSILDELEYYLRQRCSSDGEVILPSPADIFCMLDELMEAQSMAYQLHQKLWGSGK